MFHLLQVIFSFDEV